MRKSNYNNIYTITSKFININFAGIYIKGTQNIKLELRKAKERLLRAVNIKDNANYD